MKKILQTTFFNLNVTAQMVTRFQTTNQTEMEDIPWLPLL